jgi:predicted transposase/invertase (TIGR01784 family)
MRTVFNDKETLLDIKAKDNEGKIYDIEIQSIGSREFIQRSLYYWAKLYASQLKTGHEYKKLNPVICINLLDFILFPEKKDDLFHSCHMICDLDDLQTVLTDHLSIHYIELPRIKPVPENIPTDRLLKWAWFFREEGVVEEEDMKILIKDDPIFEKAHNTFNQFTANDELRDKYEARMKYEHDRAQAISDGWEDGRELGLELGLKEGLKKGILKTAEAMKQNGIASEIIQKTTGLTAEEIDAL